MKHLFLLSFFYCFFSLSISTEANQNNLQKIEINSENSLTPTHNKKTIAIFPFKGMERFNSLVTLHGLVTEAVSESGRFSLVERAQIDALIREMEEQMGVDYRNTEFIAEQGVAMGAQYMMFGNVNNIQITKETDRNTVTKKYETTYKCNVQINLKIVDTGTREVKATETINVGGGTSSLLDFNFATGDTEVEAWNKACKKIVKEVKGFIKKAIPVQISIVQIESEKKGKASEILIAGGSNVGLSKNEKLTVFEVSELAVNGEVLIREKEIATLSVSELQGKNLSVCKVKTNGDVLREKIVGGATLICKTQ